MSSTTLRTNPPTGPGRRLRHAFAASAVALSVVTVTAAPAQAATPVVYQGHVYSSSAVAASADKPQSKLWHTAGSWWALMVTPGGSVNVHELGSDHVWRDTGTVVDDRATSTGDALFSEGSLYVASRTAGSAGAVRVYRFVFDAAARTYTQVAAPYRFPGGGTESVAIDQDSSKALWATFTRGSAVYVAHTTDAARTSWTEPFRITGADTAVSADDISTVIAFDGKIGVLWSDQATVATRFAYHVDGAPDADWTVETPLSGNLLADDHLNIKSLQGDDQGRLYAAVKTSKTGASDPSLVVLTRTAAGSWSSATTATVADGLTRPQIALDKTNRTMYVLQSRESGGSVYYKSAPLSDAPSFPAAGRGATFIAWSGARINDVSTSKDPVTAASGLVGIATDQFAKRYYHAELALPAATTPTPPPPAATTRQVVVNPDADTRVEQQAPTTAFGGSTSLLADTQQVSGNAATAAHSYLRFTVPALAPGETVTGASLSVQVTNSTTNGPKVWRTGDGWDEASTTWAAGRPARVGSAAVGNFGSMSTGRRSTPVTGVAAAGAVSLELAPDSTNGLTTSSRESSTISSRPQLVVTVTTSS